MTSTLLEQGREHIFYATFVARDSSEAVLDGLPTVKIISFFNNVKDTILPETEMALVEDTTYAYRYYFGKTQIGDYVAIYKASYTDGTDLTFEEPLTICSKDFFQRIKGAGITKTKIITKDDKSYKDLIEEVKSIKSVVDDISSKDISGLLPIANIEAIGVNQEKHEKLLFDVINSVSLSQNLIQENISKKFSESESKYVTKDMINELQKQLESIQNNIDKLFLKTLSDEELEELANGQS